MSRYDFDSEFELSGSKIYSNPSKKKSRKSLDHCFVLPCCHKRCWNCASTFCFAFFHVALSLPRGSTIVTSPALFLYLFQWAYFIKALKQDFSKNVKVLKKCNSIFSKIACPDSVGIVNDYADTFWKLEASHRF